MTKSRELWKDSFAYAPLTNMEVLITTALGVLLLVIVFQVAPLIGISIDEATALTGGNGTDAVAATGQLIPDAEEFELTVGDAVTIGAMGSTIFEFSMEGGCIDPTAVCIEGVEPCASVLFPMLAEAIEANATAAALVDVEVFIHPLHNVTCMDIVADTPGTDGNSIITYSRIYHGWAEFTNETLTGGVDGVSGSDWASDDIPTGVEMWAENASILMRIMFLGILGMAIMYIKGML